MDPLAIYEAKASLSPDYGSWWCCYANGVCIIELKDCQSAKQPKTVLIKHIVCACKHTRSRTCMHFMLANKAEVCQSVQRDRFRYCDSNQGPLMALTEPPGEFPANHSLLN